MLTSRAADTHRGPLSHPLPRRPGGGVGTLRWTLTLRWTWSLTGPVAGTSYLDVEVDVDVDVDVDDVGVDVYVVVPTRAAAARAARTKAAIRAGSFRGAPPAAPAR